ncbi:hypothetical protein 2 [Hubei sobemo-like virus 28]|uniref:hypothetical protein 2 n=1 Tax=Hubei sobemo-like virus 28 TaxID=1923214 RepID=UPI00090BC434|nr:hypothetical protein 2 [Hubei sobemo-like virus 28]APG75791.1 hypothetical protein 2 [Hubei sobemo-like virus 28]
MGEAIIDRAVQQHRSARWVIPEDFISRAHFDRVLQKLDMQSSPGYPYCVRIPVNAHLFGVNADGEKDPDAVERVWEAVQHRLGKLLDGEEDCDPIRLFIKPEPLKEKKLTEHRYRIISSVSIVDQIIDHLLFDDMNETMYANWHNVPSMVGWSPFVGGWKVMPKLKWLAIDKSSWDWTVHKWILDQCLELRTRLCDNMNAAWLKLARARYHLLYDNPVLVTSGGVLLRQKTPGVMKSGCVNTIADNSIAQYLLDLRVCFEIGLTPGYLMSMGDDTLQQKPRDLQKYLDALSSFCIVKQATEANEFAGMLFNGRNVEPLYHGKHACTILHAKPEILEELADAYTLLYHRSKFRNWFENLFTAMGIDFHPRWKRDAIYDGED